MDMFSTVQPDAPPDDGPERSDMTADGAGGTDPHQNEQAAPVGKLEADSSASKGLAQMCGPMLPTGDDYYAKGQGDFQESNGR